MIKFKIINCDNYIYISDTRYEGSYSSYTLDVYLFDGLKVENTNKKGWYKLNKIPTKVEQKQSNQNINIRYELKNGYPVSELTPKIITKEMYNSENFEAIIGMYEYKYDILEGGYEEIEFEINTIYSRKDFEFIPNKFNASVDLLTQIEYPEEAYQDRPCSLNSKQMFDIIKNYVKENINTTYAKITSDYNFHFEVKKTIQLSNPYSKTVDANNSWMNKRKKPKWVEHMISEKTVSVLNIKNESNATSYGDNCVVAPTLTGKNFIDLQNKVELYLNELMKLINKKYKECPHCQGWGITEEE